MNFETRGIPSPTAETRAAVRAKYLVDEAEALHALIERLGLAPDRRKAVSEEAARLIVRVRNDTDPTMMEAFLDEYGV